MSEVFPLKEIPLPVKVYPLKQPRLYKLHSQYPAITISSYQFLLLKQSWYFAKLVFRCCLRKRIIKPQGLYDEFAKDCPHIHREKGVEQRKRLYNICCYY